MKTIATDLQREVIDELEWEPSLDHSKIGVTVENGVVVLSGHVRTLAERQVAEQAAKRVRGVRTVANELEVQLAPTSLRDDVQIASAARHALQWNVVVPDERIKVAVSAGWITLEGDVTFEYQRRAAEAAVAHLVGVRGVTNRVVVRPQVTSTDVRRNLNRALHRYAQLEAEKVKPDLADGKVTLTGRVRSWSERDVIENAAWSTPGVSVVENRLEVGL